MQAQHAHDAAALHTVHTSLLLEYAQSEILGHRVEAVTGVLEPLEEVVVVLSTCVDR